MVSTLWQRRRQLQRRLQQQRWRTGECSTDIVIWRGSAIIWHPFQRLCIYWYPKKRRIFGLLFVLQKKTNTQIKHGHFVMCIHVSGQRNHLFCKTNIQMRHFRVKPLHTFALVCSIVFCVFEYPCIGAKKSQPNCLTWKKKIVIKLQ